MREADGTTSGGRAEPLLGPVRSRSSVEELVDRILTAIALGEFEVGDRLPAERDLASVTGVSRNTVRDALGRLSAMGVLEVRRGRTGGAFVQETWNEQIASGARRAVDTDWPELKLLLDLHSLIEGLVAGVATERARAPQRRRIEAATEAHRLASTPADIRATDRELHQAIADAAGNHYLLEIRDRVAAAVGLRFSSDPYVDDPAVTRRAVRQHKAILDAILAKDAARAQELTRRHFEINADAVEALRKLSLPPKA
jgi:DNA-binding FadR family transcriptional regulator